MNELSTVEFQCSNNKLGVNDARTVKAKVPGSNTKSEKFTKTRSITLLLRTEHYRVSKTRIRVFSKILQDSNIDVSLLHETHATLEKKTNKKRLDGGHKLLRASYSQPCSNTTYIWNDIEHA